MDESSDDLARRLAGRVGSGVERSVAGILDELEDVALWFLEQAASNGVLGEHLPAAGDTVRKLHTVTRPLPRRLGRLAAVTTLAGARIAAELQEALRDVDEGATIPGSDVAGGDVPAG